LSAGVVSGLAVVRLGLSTHLASAGCSGKPTEEPLAAHRSRRWHAGCQQRTQGEYKKPVGPRPVQHPAAPIPLIIAPDRAFRWSIRRASAAAKVMDAMRLARGQDRPG
jgi:hypothetical protein